MAQVSQSYPRIEVYSEIDQGDPNAGSQTWTDPSGRTVHGGRRDYRPHILRTSYRVSKADQDKLLATVLRFQPYFGEQKPEITLGQYFQAFVDPNRTQAFRLLPTNLNFLLRQKGVNDGYRFFNTLLNYQDRQPNRMTVVWLDPRTWYVDDVFYTAGDGLSDFMKDDQEDTVAEGAFADFLRFSPIFQSKLTEGFSNLRFPVEQPALPLDAVVLAASLSPGSPGSQSYHCEIAGDGSIMRGGFKTDQKVDLNGLTALLVQANRISWGGLGGVAPKPFVHDGQTAETAFWQQGRLLKIDEEDPALGSLQKDFLNNVKIFLDVGRDHRSPGVAVPLRP